MLDSMDTNTTTVAPYATRAEFDEAVTTAAQAAKAYYDTDAVVMVDADYDLLVDRIAATRDAHPDWDDAGVSSQVAGGQSTGGTIFHRTPMLSLAKVTDINPAHNGISENADLDAFFMRSGITGFNVEVKLDGNAISVFYENGRLVRAVTRGDGLSGEDVTVNVLRGVAGLPLVLSEPWTGEVRGEIFMTDDDFEAASANRVKAGGKPFANPRNATSGSLRAIDRTYEAPMSFGAYSLTDDMGVTTHTALMQRAEALGFTTAASLTPGDAYCDSVADAKFQIVRIKVARDTLGFPIDGAVISYDRFTERARVGEGNRTPKWAIAWKYPPREAQSILRSIEIGVGKTGRMSLTAHIDPVYVDGSTVAKASGHNAPLFMSWGMGVGHRVMVVKRGDIIPYISLLDGPQDENVTPWVAPDECPQCGEEWDKSSLLWRCHTPSCSIAGRIAYFASRDCLDIEGLGDTVAEALANLTHADGSPVVKDVADLYDLTAEQWANLPMGTTSTGGVRRLGEANAAKIMESMEKAKSQPFNRLVTALGIRMTGRSVGRWLAREFPTMDLLRAATVEQVASIEKMGTIKATHVVEGLAKMSDVLDRLAAHGLNMGEEPTDDGAPKPFAGQTYVVSGSVPGYTRTTVQERIEALGGKASSSVSKTTTALVTSEEGTSKAKKAATLGIPVIDPDEFVKMLNG
jgi:DNA ligase (NAD+)